MAFRKPIPQLEGKQQIIESSKASATHSGTTLIRRSRLHARFNRVKEFPLTLVIAPTHYGKTTAIMEYCRQRKAEGNVTIRIELQDSHGALLNFLACLEKALRKSRIVWSCPTDQDDLPLASFDAIIDHFVDAISSIDSSIVLILDNAWNIDRTETLTFLELVVERLVRNLHLIMVFRGRPSYAVGRLRIDGLLNEITHEDLKFDPAETKLLIECHGYVLPDDDLHTKITEQCEGWVGGLNLYLSAIKAENTRHNIVDDNFQRMYDFCTADLERTFHLTHLGNQEHYFLLQTSVLEELNPALCNRLTGRNDAQVILENLVSEGLFVFEHGTNRFAYRYHRMFAECLRRRLRSTNIEAFIALHLTASDLCFSDKAYERAFNHALSAGKEARAAQILSYWFDRNSDSTVSQTILGLAEKLPLHAKYTNPRLMLMEVWGTNLVWDFDKSKSLLGLARQRLEMLEKDDTYKTEEIITIRTMLAHSELMTSCYSDDVKSTKKLATELIRDYPGAHSFILGSTYICLLYAERELYELRNVDRLYKLAKDQLEENGRGLSVVFLDAAAGPAYFMAGNCAAAIQVLSDSLALVDELQGGSSDYAGLVALPLSEIHYEQNELANASALLARYLAQARIHGSIDQIISGELTQARLHRINGNAQAAFGTLEKTISFAQEHRFDRLLFAATALYVKFLISDGYVNDAVRIANGVGISMEAPLTLPSRWTTTRDELKALTEARLFFSTGRFAEALEIIRPWHAFLERVGATRSLIQWDIELARYHVQLGKDRAAKRTLLRSLGVAAHGRFLRSYLDEGHWLATLLSDDMEETVAGDPRTVEFANELRDTFFNRRRPATQNSTDLPIIEDIQSIKLTAREKSVLQLICQGLTNREIGEKLGMSESSVKWYGHQIFPKIGIRRRVQALDRARQLGLVE